MWICPKCRTECSEEAQSCRYCGGLSPNQAASLNDQLRDAWRQESQKSAAGRVAGQGMGEGFVVSKRARAILVSCVSVLAVGAIGTFLVFPIYGPIKYRILYCGGDGQLRALYDIDILTGKEKRELAGWLGGRLVSSASKTRQRILGALTRIGPDASQSLPSLMAVYDDISATSLRPSVMQTVKALGTYEANMVLVGWQVEQENARVEEERRVLREKLVRVKDEACEAVKKILLEPWLLSEDSRKQAQTIGLDYRCEFISISEKDSMCVIRMQKKAFSEWGSDGLYGYNYETGVITGLDSDANTHIRHLNLRRRIGELP